MKYEFPYIKNISDVLPAIAGRDEFTVAEKEGYTVINYNVMFEDTFPVVKSAGGNAKQRAERDLHAKLRRECRGIIFDSVSGEIIRRPFHKFFNVNEREETQDHRVDLSEAHVILDKLDGSMIAPFIVKGEMIWGTKMGATDVAKPVEEFVKNNPQYEYFARGWLDYGYTPIFEWCSRKQRIVLDYGHEDQLVLTAMRNLYTGEYMAMDTIEENLTEYNIPVVKSFDSQTDMKAFIEHTRDLQNVEGFVVRFDDGHMIKLKCDWYVQIHKAKEAILQDRNIVEIILNEKLDDVKAHLAPEDRDRLTQFENDINHRIVTLVNQIWIDVQFFKSSHYSGDRKDFAITYAPNFNGFVRPIMFSMWDKEGTKSDIKETVLKTIRSNLGKTVKYEAIRDAWFPGVKFND